MYYSRLNREAFVWSLVSLALYYLVDVGLFLVINALVGYTPAEFQSTLIHTPRSALLRGLRVRGLLTRVGRCG